MHTLVGSETVFLSFCYPINNFQEDVEEKFAVVFRRVLSVMKRSAEPRIKDNEAFNLDLGQSPSGVWADPPRNISSIKKG